MEQSIILTPEEMALAANPEIMHMKNRIIQAVYELFGQLAEDYQSKSFCLPADLLSTSPKIARGENYLGLPWVMLDYPRNFSTENIFAVRTMFWWGHEFSMHLLLKGKWMHLLNTEKLMANTGRLKWHFNTNANPWEHHFDETSSIALSDLKPDKLNTQIDKNAFVKVSCRLPTGEWLYAKTFLQEAFFEILQFINIANS